MRNNRSNATASHTRTSNGSAAMFQNETEFHSLHFWSSINRPNKRTPFYSSLFVLGFIEMSSHACGVQIVPINLNSWIDLSGFNLSKCEKECPIRLAEWMRWFIWNVSDYYRKAINPQMVCILDGCVCVMSLFKFSSPFLKKDQQIDKNFVI